MGARLYIFREGYSERTEPLWIKNINVMDLMVSHEEVSSTPLGEGKLRIDRGSLARMRMPAGHF